MDKSSGSPVRSRHSRECKDGHSRFLFYIWLPRALSAIVDSTLSRLYRRISNVVSGPVSFGLIPHDHWFQPDWIDEEKASEGRKKMEQDGIIYGGSLSYRNMCRFNSGFFYRHPILQQFKWYWRVEPDVHFHCNIDFDPFLYMEDNNKVYCASYAFSCYPYLRIDH